MNIRKIDNTKFGARLRFCNQQIQSQALPVKTKCTVIRGFKHQISYVEKRLMTVLSISDIVKRIKNIKNSVKFPD